MCARVVRLTSEDAAAHDEDLGWERHGSEQLTFFFRLFLRVSAGAVRCALARAWGNFGVGDSATIDSPITDLRSCRLRLPIILQPMPISTGSSGVVIFGLNV